MSNQTVRISDRSSQISEISDHRNHNSHLRSEDADFPICTRMREVERRFAGFQTWNAKSGVLKVECSGSDKWSGVSAISQHGKHFIRISIYVPTGVCNLHWAKGSVKRPKVARPLTLSLSLSSSLNGYNHRSL